LFCLPASRDGEIFQLRILLVHNYYEQAGGESGVFDNLLRLLERVGQEVEVYSRHNSEILSFSRQAKARTAVGAFFSFRTWSEVKDLVQRKRPAVALVQNVFPLISPSVYYALQSEGIPTVQLVYNYRFVCPDAQLFSRGEICERCVLGNHWHAVARKCYRDSRALSAWYAAILKLHRVTNTFARKNDLFVIPDNFLGTRLIKGGIPADKIKKNVNPFFVDDYLPSYEPGEYILYVGRLVKQKGVFTLIKAMSHSSESPPLYIVGDGESRRELETLISDLDLRNRVKLLGTRWGSEVQALIRNSRFVVIPSEWYDNLPLILCQAYAMAKPVVASAINGIPEYVDNGVDGFLFEAGNAVELAERIDRLSADTEILCTMARNARRKAEEVFDYQAYWRTLSPLLEELVTQRSSQV
jgi:glycosyltransferase involved in cell wall biosynthesis